MKEQRVVDRHPVVERFELGELVGALLEEVADLPQNLRPFRGWQLAPRATVERLASGRDAAIDVLGACFSNEGQHLAGGRVDCFERLATRGVDPTPADEQFLGLALQK